MIRTHFSILGLPACGRGKRVTFNVRYVDCRLCQGNSEFIEAKANDALARKEAFDAQTPRQFREPWVDNSSQAVITCSTCGGTTFRQGERSCMGHYDNFVCASCGDTTSRLTETGMSF